MHSTLTRERLPNREILANFLALPPEALASANWIEDVEQDLGGPWAYLRDHLRPADRRRLPDVSGLHVRLHADRGAWRDGIAIQLD